MEKNWPRLGNGAVLDWNKTGLGMPAFFCLRRIRVHLFKRSYEQIASRFSRMS